MTTLGANVISLGVMGTRGVGFEVIARFLVGTGVPTITGHLGKTSREAIMVGLAWVDHHLGCIDQWLGEDKEEDQEGQRVFSPDRDVAIHFSNVGTLSKTGFSLGAAAATAVVASYLNDCYDMPLKKGTAITGEINLSGQVLPVADISIKIKAAKRLGTTQRTWIPSAQHWLRPIGYGLNSTCLRLRT